MLRATLAVALLAFAAAPAQAQVRLAAPEDCLTNAGCGRGRAF